MVTIRMLKTTPGSPDGYYTKMYEEGKEYTADIDIPPRLAKTFVEDMKKVAVYVTGEKAVPAAPENAAIKVAPENKVEAPKTVEEKPEEKEHGWEPPKKKDKSDGKVMRVYELADQLGIASKDILIIVENLGIYARNPASGLSEEEVAKVKAALKK